MFCYKCGAQIPDDSLFCSKCGTKVKVEEPNKLVQNEMPTSFVGLRLISRKCLCCGNDQLRKASPTEYHCDYCGSDFITDDSGIVASCRVTPKEVVTLFFNAAKYEAKNDYASELKILLEYRDKVSGNDIFLLKLGRSYRRNGFNRDALECYSEAQKINPNNANIYINKGALYILSKDYENGLRYVEQGLELLEKDRIEYHPDEYSVALSNKACALAGLGRKKEAEEWLRKAEKEGYEKGNKVRQMFGLKRKWF